MNILMIVPNLAVLENSKRKVPTVFSSSGAAFKILAALTPPCHNVKIVNEVLGDRVDFNADYDLVAITMLTSQADRGYLLGEKFKAKNVPVVYGGIHASTLPDEALTHGNAVCIGEGERVWGQILLDAQNGTLNGIYKSDELIDMREIPRAKLDDSKKDLMENYIQTTRGCPHKCSFCTVKKFYGNAYRTSPIEDIIEEIKYKKAQKKLRYNFIVFTDDNIIGNEAYAKELFTALIPLKIRWLSQTSINIAYNDELLDLAKKSGCIGFMIGFDSINPASLDNANKQFAKKIDYTDAIKRIYKRNIFILGMFIFGFDTDTEQIFEDTYNFIHDNHITYGYLNILTPFPGTVYYDEFKKDGRLLDCKWSDYDLMHIVFKPKNMTKERIQFLRCFYTKKINKVSAILKRVFASRAQIPISLFLSFSCRSMFKIIPNL